jgi:hypothetical protein
MFASQCDERRRHEDEVDDAFLPATRITGLVLRARTGLEPPTV